MVVAAGGLSPVMLCFSFFFSLIPSKITLAMQNFRIVLKFTGIAI
jgi:hypothetical protein